MCRQALEDAAATWRHAGTQLRCVAAEIAKITTRLCGIMNGPTLSGATAGAGGIAAGAAAPPLPARSPDVRRSPARTSLQRRLPCKVATARQHCVAGNAMRLRPPVGRPCILLALHAFARMQ